MLKNYFVIAWRQLKKNKLYASINVLGLAVGLTVYVFGTMMVEYEHTHDLFWDKGDRIYTAGTRFGPAANIGVAETDGIYTAFGPLIENEITDIQAVARTVSREYLVSVNDDHFYQSIRFVDQEFVQIFDFDYLEGDASALDDPMAVVLSRSTKEKLFGDQSAVGKTMTLDHGEELHVTAVIEDLPINSHFSSSIMSESALEMFAPLRALNRIAEYNLDGNFNNLSTGDNTYMLLPPGKDLEWLQLSIDGVYDRHFPEDSREFISGLKARPLVAMNTVIWDAVGLPVIESVGLLAILVLIVAIVNYTNLATAQSLGRNREIGLRKTMGASKSQLITQFLVESWCVTLIAMVLCVALIAIITPVFNTASGKGLSIDWLAEAPWLVITTIVVALVAGAYPAYLITGTRPIQALRDNSPQTVKGSAFRTGMLILQFSISILMLALVAVVYLQNKKVEDGADIYPKSQIVTLSRLRVEAVNSRLDTLKNEIARLPGVIDMTYTTHLPFQQSNSSTGVSNEAGSREDTWLINQIWIDEDFFTTLDIPVIAGRGLDKAITGDTVSDTAANVVVNELALSKLGYTSANEALGKVFYESRDEEEPRVHTIVGVIPDQNFQGFHNQVKPTMFKMTPEFWNYAAVRVEFDNLSATRAEIEDVWQKVIPDYPIQAEYLEDEFKDTYEVYQGIANIMGGFAFVAMALSLIGLFGLAAFMAASRTKEIGIRKVMGASSAQLSRLLIWRFSKPVMWALLIALPLAYLAASQFLQFFADRIGGVEFIVLASGVAAVLVAWSVVGLHATKVAQANPIAALRHE